MNGWFGRFAAVVAPNHKSRWLRPPCNPCSESVSSRQSFVRLLEGQKQISLRNKQLKETMMEVVLFFLSFLLFPFAFLQRLLINELGRHRRLPIHG